MHIQKKFLCLVIALYSLKTAHAEIQIFPAREIISMNQACRSNLKEYKMNDASVVCDFKQAISFDETQKKVEEVFRTYLKQAFIQHRIVDSENEIDNAPTYVADLEVIRADELISRKNKEVEITLPLTLSLKLTDASNGEVVYRNRAAQTNKIVVDAEALNSLETKKLIQQTFQTSFLKLTKSLTDISRPQLNYQKIETSKIGQWKSFVILDRGLEGGIGTEDELRGSQGDMIRVVHSTPQYAVAIPLTRDLKSTSFLKTSMKKENSGHKIKVPIVDVLTYQGESADLVEQYFNDGLTDQASFTVPKYNKQLNSTRLVAKNVSLVSKPYTQMDEFTPYSIRLTLMPFNDYEQEGGMFFKKSQRVMHLEVLAEMLHHSGQVIYSSNAAIKYGNSVNSHHSAHGNEIRVVKLNNSDDVKDELLQLALSKLGKDFKDHVNFKEIDLAVLASSPRNIMIPSAGRHLAKGMKIKVFRTEKINDLDVMLPIWNATVVEHNSQVTIARLDQSLVLGEVIPTRPGDHVRFQSPLRDSISSAQVIDKAQLNRLKSLFKQ
ncbi:hypothetical protein G9F32_00215 [Acinetobacter sp. 194]|uniref:hypothetical protein n=1 Tax=Acinetobacter shaoyimingii TaxID=2715164 RepID=UPI00140C81EF|nr:hypothetical protein [Acinetobacter shaoyimingii]NHB56460.1 hypothetical protein [Acinetobacter shaoyimingii]